ncbi:heme biosynthesis protein HemY [Bartonella sp. DGB2]|uniref:heme biosynthesis protein HemY n=1 Tax=Bartonella sp. DGB2 TaxID=3388426 RepID=UPI00398FC7E0
MIRVLFYLIAVVLLGACFAFIANHNSLLVVYVGQMRVSVSLLVVVSFLVLSAILWVFIGGVWRWPYKLYQKRRERQLRQGYGLLVDGLLASFSGEREMARRLARRLPHYLNMEEEPLGQFLAAQSLILDNDEEGAAALYQNMLATPRSEVLGLYGLFMAAKRAGQHDEALDYARRAEVLAPHLVWAYEAMLDHYAEQGSWDQALMLYERRQKALPRVERSHAENRRQKAVLLVAQARSLISTHLAAARKAALAAHKLAPDFVPACCTAAGILYRFHEKRRADRLLEAAWKRAPHPDLAALYLRSELPATHCLRRAQKLASFQGDEYYSLMTVARAALAAGAFKLARESAEKAVKLYPRQDAYSLLAAIEDVQSNDQGRVREWLSLALRAEWSPVWMADGAIFEEWAPVSPLSGRFDCFVWQVPAMRSSSPYLASGTIDGLVTLQGDLLANNEPLIEGNDVLPTPAESRKVEKAFGQMPTDEDKTVFVTPAGSSMEPSREAIASATMLSELSEVRQNQTVLMPAAPDEIEAEEGYKESSSLLTRLNVDDPGVISSDKKDKDNVFY